MKNFQKSFKYIFVLALMLPVVLFSACGDNDKFTSINIKMSGNVTEVLPGRIYDIVPTTNNDDLSNITYVAEQGAKYVKFENNKIHVLSTTDPGQKITFYAEKESIKSNVIELTVEHIEATSVTLTDSNHSRVAGEYFTPTLKVEPRDYTRPVELISSNTNVCRVTKDTNGNFILTVSQNAAVGTTFNVYAKCGEATSDRVVYQIVTRGEVLGFYFDDSEINQNTITLDASIATVKKIEASVRMLEGDKITERKLSAVAYELEFSGDLSKCPVILNTASKTVTANYTGSVRLKCTLGEKSSYLNFNVYTRPDIVNLPGNFRSGLGQYYYGKDYAISNFIPEFVNDRGNKDFELILSSSGGNVIAKYQYKDDRFNAVVSHNAVSYNDGKLHITQPGEYTVKFRSITQCATERESTVMNLCINTGVNVYNQDEFLSMMEGSTNKVVNLASNIIFSVDRGVSDTFTSIGDKELNGNGFKIDVSGKDWGVKVQGDNSESNAMYSSYKYLMNFTSVDQFTPYVVTLRDFEVIGNFGNLSAEAISNKTGIDKNVLMQNTGTPFFKAVSYYAAIMISPQYVTDDTDATKTYTYAIPRISNLTVRDFHGGIRLFHALDESLKDPTLPAGIDGVTVSNLFADGLAFQGSQVRVRNFNVTSPIGGSPVVGNGPGVAMKAGVHRNEQAEIVLSSGNLASNMTDGNSIYLRAQIAENPDSASIVSSLGGIAGILNTVSAAKVSAMAAPYYQKGDFETAEKIKSYTSNILNLNSGGVQEFNLFCFNAVKGYKISFDSSMEGKWAPFANSEIVKGVNTTAEYIYINAYDAISDMGGIVAALGDMLEILKSYIIIIRNFNYVASA